MDDDVVDRDAVPLLFLDLDGVLALREVGDVPKGFTATTVSASDGRQHEILLNRGHGPWLRERARRFELVWATGWEHPAPRILGPFFDLPPFPVVRFTQRPRLGVPLRKVEDVETYASGAPLAWVDDDLDEDAEAWAAGRRAPTLLIRPDQAIGLPLTHVEQLVALLVNIRRRCRHAASHDCPSPASPVLMDGRVRRWSGGAAGRVNERAPLRGAKQGGGRRRPRQLPTSPRSQGLT